MLTRNVDAWVKANPGSKSIRGWLIQGECDPIFIIAAHSIVRPDGSVIDITHLTDLRVMCVQTRRGNSFAIRATSSSGDQGKEGSTFGPKRFRLGYVRDGIDIRLWAMSAAERQRRRR
jgi:hypothetical protein